MRFLSFTPSNPPSKTFNHPKDCSPGSCAGVPSSRLGLLVGGGMVLDLARAAVYLHSIRGNGIRGKEPGIPEAAEAQAGGTPSPRTSAASGVPGDGALSDLLSLIRGRQAALDLCQEVRDFVLELEDPAGASYLGEPLLYPETKVLFEPPLSNPGKIICPGLNFEEHVTESKSAAFLSRPPFPMAFARFASTLIGHRRPVIHPSRTACLDYEVEMAVIIGTEARSVPREKALSMVWGYTVFNDLSVRDLQLAEMKAGFLLAGKNMDTLGPIGPWAVTAEEIRDPHLLDLRLKVNGELRQSSSTRFMIYRFDELIAYWSSVLTLHPGDIITSGTPSGVAMGRKPDPSPYYLKPGDVVEAEIENIGTLVNPIVSDSQRHQQSPR